MFPLTSLLNRAAQEVLDIDQESRDRLAALGEHLFCIELTVPVMSIYLQTDAAGMQFYDSGELSSEPQVVVTLRGSLPAFARLGRLGADSGVLSDGEIEMSGDAELGQALQKVLADLDIDWEEILSRSIGDTAAHKIANLAQQMSGWAQQVGESARRNTADYLTEEKRILPSDTGMEDFVADLDKLRADVDRLEQQIKRLISQK